MYKVRAQQWYNGAPPRNLSGFADAKSNRLIGWVMMRQLRVKPRPCPVKQPLASQCADMYSFGNEEKGSFAPGWKSPNQTAPTGSNATVQRAFTYRSGDELGSYMSGGDHGSYASGGYVYEFRGRLSDLQSNLSELHRFEWIDRYTRAVIIDCSLYNPNVALFTSASLLTEFLPIGSVHSQSRFESLSFQREYRCNLPGVHRLTRILVFTSLSQLLGSLFYMIFVVYMMVEEVRSFHRLKAKYFHEFWAYINLGIIVCSWTSVGIYIWRYTESNRIGHLFKTTNGYVYINLQLAVYINTVYTHLAGFCCFFGTIKFVRLCRIHRRILLFIETLRHAANDLLSFSMMFCIVFTAFMCLFYFLFISSLFTCASIWKTVEMLFEMTLMKFDAYELVDASSFLGPFCFTLFILIVVFICLNMFLTIINDSFRSVRDNFKLHQADDEQIFAYMLQRLRRWTGRSSARLSNCSNVFLGKRDEREIVEERDKQMRSEYREVIAYFPHKIDQLLDALNKVAYPLSMLTFTIDSPCAGLYKSANRCKPISVQ